jgi:hypothetical protein
MAAPTLPEQLQREFDDMASKYSICIHTQDYPTALTIIKNLYDKMLAWQGQYQERFHKGYPIHNIGYTLYLQNKHQEAIKYFVLAYVEDLLSGGIESEADSTPAGKTLLLSYRVSPEFLEPLKQTVIKLKNEGRIPTKPEEVIRELGKSEAVYYKDLEGKVTVRPKRPRLRKFAEFSSEWGSRVFIGGSSGLSPIIEEMRDKVETLGCDPVVATDFDMPEQMTIYHKCLTLLHSCKYAIFDLSEQAGQLVELERAFEYGVQTLVVWPKKKEESITQMLKSVVKHRSIICKPYDEYKDMDDIFGEFLHRSRTPAK